MSHYEIIEKKPKSESQFLLLTGVLALLFLVLIGALLVNRSGSATEAEDADRAGVRTKNLADLQSADTALLTSYGWNDKAKRTIHIPITNAMQLVLPSLKERTQIPTQR